MALAKKSTMVARLEGIILHARNEFIYRTGEAKTHKNQIQRITEELLEDL